MFLHLWTPTISTDLNQIYYMTKCLLYIFLFSLHAQNLHSCPLCLFSHAAACMYLKLLSLHWFFLSFTCSILTVFVSFASLLAYLSSHENASPITAFVNRMASSKYAKFIQLFLVAAIIFMPYTELNRFLHLCSAFNLIFLFSISAFHRKL